MSEQRITRTTLEFPYTRTMGPVMGPFLHGLADRRLLAARGADGRVLFPPVEYDPESGKRLDQELVEVGPEATVTSWTWVAEPTDKHPLGHPFAFALVRPDGADTAMVHAVDAGDASAMSTGMRVRPRWRTERRGFITDLEAWEAVPS